jgi:hypothetical protein
VAGDAGLHQRPGIGAAAQRRGTRVLDHRGQRPGCHRRPGIEQHERAGQAQHLVDGVADVEHGQVELVAQALDIGQHLGLARRVQRGQRFVHQQQARLRQQGTADRHALALPPGQRVRRALQQGAEPEQFHHGVEGHACRLRARASAPQPVAQVAVHRQVREQPRVLEHHAERTPVHRQVDAARAVEEDLAAHLDAAAVRAQQPGHEVHERGLARAAGAEQGRQARQRQVDLAAVFEAAQALARGHAQPVWRSAVHQACPIWRRTRCARRSETTMAASASASEISTRRSAAASPPGVCVRL